MRPKAFTAFLALVCLACLPVFARPATAAAPRILCSAFPIHLIALQVTRGIEGLAPELMIPANLGCPHDYALTPPDMQKLARADVLVINGLGMEEFLGQPVKKANPALAIVDSSAGIEDLLDYDEEHDEAHEAQPAHAAQTASGKHGQPHEHAHGEAAHGEHGAPNPHLFASPRMAARLARNIAAGLAALDPPRAAQYQANASAYAQRMNALADECAALGRRLINPRIVTQHGVFDYLARDMGLEVVAVVQAHAGQEPSAAQILAIVKTVRARQAGAIFTEPQYPPQIAKTIAKEADIPMATLDPVASGPDQAPLDYYETAMRANLQVLAATLGTR